MVLIKVALDYVLFRIKSMTGDFLSPRSSVFDNLLFLYFFKQNIAKKSPKRISRFRFFRTFFEKFSTSKLSAIAVEIFETSEKLLIN